jgi:hypothetical protein
MKRVAALGAAMISTPKGTFILAGLLYTIVFGALLWPNFPTWTNVLPPLELEFGAGWVSLT